MGNLWPLIPFKHMGRLPIWVGYIFSLRQLILTFCFIRHFALVLVFLISFDYTLFIFRLGESYFWMALEIKAVEYRSPSCLIGHLNCRNSGYNF